MKFEVRKSPKPCPLCGKMESIIFFEETNIPCSCNQLWPTKAKAVNCPKGDIVLAFCPSCRFITNCALEPDKNQYNSMYDNSLFYSAHFQSFAEEFVAGLIKQYDLHNKTVMEITCGKVNFLSFFSTMGPNNTVKLSTLSGAGGKIINAAASSTPVIDGTIGSSEAQKIDFVFSYHELEHANSPKGFLGLLRKKLGGNLETVIFLAVPNALKAFDEGSFSDIIYEHVSYFTVPSLYFLFDCCGFRILDITETKGGIFDSIYIVAQLKSPDTSSSKLESALETRRIEDAVLSFGMKSNEMLSKQTELLVQFLDQGKKIVVWGAGARGVTFLNLFGDLRVEYAVDINPRKQGKYVPGTGQKIVDPRFLLTYKPDFIVIANPAYEREIRKIVNDLGVKTEFILI